MALIETIYGQIDESLLVSSSGVIDAPTFFSIWVEYRLRDTPEVAMLRTLQFPRVHTTEHGTWDICVVCTGDRGGGHTPSCPLVVLLRAADVRGAQVLCRMEARVFDKVNTFDAPAPGGTIQFGGVDIEVPPGYITADLGDSKITVICEDDLVKTIGVVDTENEYTCWVEYRQPGDDRIVHRSASVVAKKSLEMFRSLGGSFLAQTQSSEGPTSI